MPIDSLLQPRVGALHAGVSRQAPLLRSPSQMEEIINFLPSVDKGGLVDRNGSALIAAIGGGQYQDDGHFMFRTADGQRWVALRRTDAGGLDIRSLSNGALATLTVGPYAQNYIGTTQNLKFLQINDTVLVLNPTVVTKFNSVTKPAPTRTYLVIKKLSTYQQTFNVNCSLGSASHYYDGSGGTTRDSVAEQLMNKMAAALPSLGFTRVNNVIRIEGPAAVMATFTSSNSWDETALTVIKGRVSAITDLPATGFSGEPILVSLGSGDSISEYYVTYDVAKNAYIETSYLDNQAISGSWDASTLPMRIHQTGTASFELQPVDWVTRKTGDDDSNAAPNFNGAVIRSMALWKGRLWFATNDWVVSSQPDDLFNFFQTSAKQQVASDPVKLQAEADKGIISHLISFKDNLMVFTDKAQCSIDGSQAVKPDTASLGTATTYPVDPDVTPQVLGENIYYSGTEEGRSVLWEYRFTQDTMNNTATDLSKHVPEYCPGDLTMIDGSAQSGRVFMVSKSDMSTLYVQTSYWLDQQRKQNAWSKITLAAVDKVLHLWVDRKDIFLLVQISGFKLLISLSVAGDTKSPRLDLQTPVQVTWNETRNRTEVVVPYGLTTLASPVLLAPRNGWYGEYPLTVVYDGTQYVAYTTEKIDTSLSCIYGARFTSSWTFSPFYPTSGDYQTPAGRLQVYSVLVDFLMTGDFSATLVRPDRKPDMTVALSPQKIGTSLQPKTGANTQYKIPFNCKGDVGVLTVSKSGTFPTIVTGYTLAAKYSNLFAS